MENPWNVKNLDEFLYYWCPECDNKDQYKDLFVKHALETHPNSREYIVRLAIKKEEDEDDVAQEDFIADVDEYDSPYMEPKIELMENIKSEDDSDI